MQLNFVRRIDELGRIVIPKEIRGKLRIESGELLDLNISDDSLVIKRASGLINVHYAKLLVELIGYFSKVDIIITQGEKVEVVSENLDKKIIGKEISEKLKEILKLRQTKDMELTKVVDDYELKGKVLVKSIIKDSDALGLIIIKYNDLENVNDFMKTLMDLLIM